MNASKLFQVLVVGGAMLGTGCTSPPPVLSGADAQSPGADAQSPGADAQSPGADARSAGADARSPSDDAATAHDGATRADAPSAAADVQLGGDAALVDCGLCPNELCCEPDGAGRARTRAGMMCCWSTSC